MPPMDLADLGAKVAGVAALDQPLRRDLYALLARRNTWVSRDEAADALGVPRSVAAFHLDKLAEAGLVQVRFERPPGRGGPGAGRPAKRYRRSDTEVSVSLPERHYDLVGAVLADAVTDATQTGRPVEAAVADAARRVGGEIGASVREEPPPGARRRFDPTDAAITALQRLGYEPSEHEGAIVLANCPFHRLAERHRDLVCGMNLQLLSGLAEALGTQDLALRLQPTEGMCCVRLEPMQDRSRG
jgi:predicted ArsR family transcriptional regulator